MGPGAAVARQSCWDERSVGADPIPFLPVAGRLDAGLPVREELEVLSLTALPSWERLPDPALASLLERL